ncbi:hypothetical protein CBR_g48290 [Chara braunii]|uniref:CCHC-type domain-containing protein n=1 Tax=Chara braunii TaxID=69332 RepID=A0A388K433_CHABU|nr:hypothetical protein CBR_g48290 [Chara braunii]|eukprot:GBG64822.1 hypothetical protein CBR_g48290 [Chara braunii]
MAGDGPRNSQGDNINGGGERDRDRDHDRGRNWDREHDRDREQDRDQDRDPDRNQRRGPPMCFKCDKIDHYANQCSWFDTPSTLRDSYRGRSSSPRRGHQMKSSSSVWRDLIDLDAKALEAMCKSVGVEYRDKMNTIFGIADQKAVEAYDLEHESEAAVKALTVEEVEVGSGNEDDEDVEAETTNRE